MDPMRAAQPSEPGHFHLEFSAFKHPENLAYTIAGGAGLVILITFFLVPAWGVGSVGLLFWLVPLTGIAAMAAAVRATQWPLTPATHHLQGLVLLAAGALLGGCYLGLLVFVQALFAVSTLINMNTGGSGIYWLLVLGLFTIASCGGVIAHQALMAAFVADRAVARPAAPPAPAGYASPDWASARPPARPPAQPSPPSNYAPPARPSLRPRNPYE
jgi:hypothetical protein